MSRVARQHIKGEPKVTGVTSRRGDYASYKKTGQAGPGGQAQSQGIKGQQQKDGSQMNSGNC